MLGPFSRGDARFPWAAILISAALFAVAAVAGRRGINALYGHLPRSGSSGSAAGALLDVLEMYVVGVLLMAVLVAMDWDAALEPRRAFATGAGFAALALVASWIGHIGDASPRALAQLTYLCTVVGAASALLAWVRRR